MKETLDLNYMLDQKDIIDVYRGFHPTAVEYTFFSSAHEAFSRIEYMLGNKTSLNIFKKMKLYQASFQDIVVLKKKSITKKTGKITNV